MNMTKKRKIKLVGTFMLLPLLIFLLLYVVIYVLPAGSSGSGSPGSLFGSGGSKPAAQYGTLQIWMVDPQILPAGVTDVYISYGSIQVHIANARNESGWYDVTAPGTANLTSLVVNSKLLGQNVLPSGTYNIVRFNVTSAWVTVGGKNVTAFVPSGMVQAVLTGSGAEVKSGQTSALLIDVNPRVTGSTYSGYTLVPSANAQPM
jgi:hypothetical protein